VSNDVRRSIASLSILLLAVACQAPAEDPVAARPQVSPSMESSPTAESSPTPTPAVKPDNPWVTQRPKWLGKRVLPLGEGGFGEVRPTPRILRNRRFATIDFLPRPRGRRFTSSIGPVPRKVVARSSWAPECPVTLEDLTYIRMSFWGFDRNLHTGEMIVNASVAESVVGTFRELFRIRYPIEEMRVVTAKEIANWEKKPTGDVNVTSSFECRDAAEATHWSQHAYGLAIDINPFHNPYRKGDLVVPELAGAYLNRHRHRPGMIQPKDAVTRAFADIGWGWGGNWATLDDWQHFSANGR
jgi:hypothetical protein